MMDEIINITPEMMHKFYNNLDNLDNLEIIEKNHKFYSNISKETKLFILILFIFAVILYMFLSISNDNYYQKLH